MAMTADGDSRLPALGQRAREAAHGDGELERRTGRSQEDEALAGLGLLVRLDNEKRRQCVRRLRLERHGGHPNQTDLRASMTVSNKQRERLHMAMTADGDSRNKARAGSLGSLCRRR